MGTDATAALTADLRRMIHAGGERIESVDQRLRLTPGTAQTWLAGAASIPRRQREPLQQLILEHDWAKKVDALELPKCETELRLMDTYVQLEQVAADRKAIREALRAIDAHDAECPVCRATRDRIEREVGPFPMPKELRPGREFSLYPKRLREWARAPRSLVITTPLLAGAFLVLLQRPGTMSVPKLIALGAIYIVGPLFVDGIIGLWRSR